MGVLSNLEPASVFYYFEEICGIPHTSHHEKALSDYCVQFAKAHGLACRQDEMGNVLIKAPATPGYEKEPGLILQGHLDMVGDKTADCPLDLEKDAIHPVVDGGYVCAEGTTLGGDDGIAVAYALAVLDAKDIPHPALEVVLTVCEEVGLLGASAAWRRLPRLSSVAQATLWWAVPSPVPTIRLPPLTPSSPSW